MYLASVPVVRTMLDVIASATEAFCWVDFPENQETLTTGIGGNFLVA